jgi:ribonuclease P protein component
MLPKRLRADTGTVEKIFSTGGSARSAGLSLKYLIDSKNPGPRVSFIAPKSSAKKAVSRNLLRRRGYAAMEKYFSLLPKGFRGIFIVKNPECDFEKEIGALLAKLK